MIKIGNTGIGNVYVGSTEIVKAYVGSDVVYGNAQPVPEGQLDYVISNVDGMIVMPFALKSNNATIRAWFSGDKFGMACAPLYMSLGGYVSAYDGRILGRGVIRTDGAWGGNSIVVNDYDGVQQGYFEAYCSGEWQPIYTAFSFGHTDYDYTYTNTDYRDSDAVMANNTFSRVTLGVGTKIITMELQDSGNNRFEYYLPWGHNGVACLYAPRSNTYINQLNGTFSTQNSIFTI